MNVRKQGGFGMVRLTVSTEEYLMLNDNIKIVFLGGTKNHIRILVDAPKDVNIVRSTVLEKRLAASGEDEKLPKYYAEPETDKKYLKKKKPRICITRGNLEP
ncbi:carbon storage regulator [bacterium 1xD8-48]|jgi:Carbon storage regulator (could also regulate swarming and quorum sensing)|nr:carbon storage regulator [bacterium 1xD8-48]